jgi:tetratricopeptide (TPR) repeat protein
LGQYAAERLVTSESAHIARHAHAAYYMAWLAGCAGKLRSSAQIAALAEVEEELANLRAAWQWAIHEVQLEELARGVDALCLFYEWRSYFTEGEAACESAIAALASSTIEDVAELSMSLLLYAKLLVWQSTFGRRLGRAELASQTCQEAVDLLSLLALEGHDTRAERAAALLQLGGIQWYADTATARETLLTSLAWYREAGDYWTSATVLRELARAAIMLCRLDEAYQFAQESLALRRANHDHLGLPATLGILCWITGYQGKYEEQEHYAQEQLRVAQSIGYQYMVSNAIFNLGVVYVYKGKFSLALAQFEESRTLTEESDDRHHLNTLNIWCAEANLHLGRYDQAYLFAQRALSNSGEIGLRSHRGEALLRLAKVRLVEGAYADAARLLQESDALFEAIRQPTKLIEVYACRGFAAYKMGDFALALHSLAQLRQIATQGFNVTEELLLLAALLMTELSLGLGRPEAALEIYAAAQRYPYIANSRWYADIAEPVMTAQSSKLPRAVVQAARERGAARPIDQLLAELRL